MSIQAVGWVLDHSTTRGTDRLVLISIANHAGTSPTNGAWEAWPGIDTIAREAGLDRSRTVQESLSRLITAGQVERVLNGAPDGRIRRDRRPNLYRIITGGRGDATPHPVTQDGVTPPRTPSTSTAPVDNPDHGVPPYVTPSPPRGDAPAYDGVTRQRAAGCYQASPEPSVEPSVNQPPQPPEPSELTPDAITAGGSTIDQQQYPVALTADQRRARIHEATTLIASRLAKAATGLVKPDRWIASVAERLDGEHATAGHRLLAEHPDLTPVALADLLERPPRPGVDDQRAAQRDREAETQRRIRDTLVQPGNRHRDVGEVRRLRQQLGRPQPQETTPA